MSREISYNLPGYGFANCYLFGETVDLYDLLDNNGIIEKTKKTYQLGTMKYVYPGAHHTRYEYIFTQWMLISNIVVSKGGRNVELSLSSSLKEFETRGWSLSGGTVMQCLALLSNMGHMYDTFTSSRILFRLLVESKEKGDGFYTIYKRNLPHSVQHVFDDLLSKGNYYKLHLFNAIHIMQGMVRTPANKQTCEISIHLLTQLINPELITNEATKRIFYLYKKIRKIAYLSVDMIYTPASFGANLNRMVYSISTAVDELFDDASSINQSISQLEDIIHKQIYDSAMCILTSTRIEQEMYPVIKNCIAENITDIFTIRKMIIELVAPFDKLHSQKQPNSIKMMNPKSVLLLSGDGVKDYESNYLEFDNDFIKNIPYRKLAFGTQLSQNLEKTYSAFGIIDASQIQEITQTIISKAIAFKLYSSAEKKDLVKFAIQSLYKYEEFFFNLSAPQNIDVNECVFIGQGCKNIAKQIRMKFSQSNIINPDQLHEILSCAAVLESINYSGLVVCFVGGIKACKYKDTQKADEIDGFIYFPNRPQYKDIAILVEAKNYNNGEKDAAKQLKDTQKYLSDRLGATIDELSRCAYMNISVDLAV